MKDPGPPRPPARTPMSSTARRHVLQSAAMAITEIPTAAPAPGQLGPIGFLGTGNMAEALIKGLLQAGVVQPELVFGSDPRQARCAEMKSRYGIHATTHNLDVVRRSNI